MLKHPKKPAKKKKRATGKVKKEKIYRQIDSEVLKEFVSNNVSEDVLKKLLKIDKRLKRLKTFKKQIESGTN